MHVEYRLNYSKSRPNRFSKNVSFDNLIELDPDVSKVFTTSESVNKVLRALIGKTQCLIQGLAGAGPAAQSVCVPPQ